jgi:RNA polymerase sigma factor (sigma-70 family)
MDKQPAKTTGQQDTNAALAALAAAGNTFALGQLWEINKGLLHRWFWQWYAKNKAVADEHGITLEDFEQEGFFAVQAAAKAYDPENGSFATLLGYYVQNRISKVVCGEHGRLMTTEDGREVRISANPLNGSTSLDTPLDDTDGGSATLGDLQEDPAAAQAFQTDEDELYTEELHAALEEALNKLTAKQADVVRRHYFGGKCLSEIAREDNTTRSAPYNHEQAAFLALRRNPALARWHDDILSAKAWTGTGWNAWNRYGSVQERTVEYLEKKGAEHFDYYAWRNQMIREHYAAFEADGYFDRHPEQRPEPPNG